MKRAKDARIVVVIQGGTYIFGNKTVRVLGDEKQKNETGHNAIKDLLKELLDATIKVDGKTVPLMVHQEQWYAVYRVLNEKCNYPQKMSDFCLAIKKMGMDKGRVPCVYSSLKAASGKFPKLLCSVTLWDQFKNISESYQKQYVVTDFLLNLLG